MQSNSIDPTRRALDAPPTAVTLITTELIDKAVERSRLSNRGRIILPLHKTADETLHRMFNALQPGTYIPPHRHALPPKAESILVLRGSLCFVTFGDAGQVDQMTDLTAGTDKFGVDIAPGIYHTFFILQPDTVIFEVKPGPYSPISDKDFAPWAPREGELAADGFLAGLHRLRHEQFELPSQNSMA